MAVVELSANVKIVSQELADRALRRAWEQVRGPEIVIPLVAQELMAPLAALGYSAMRTSDLEFIEAMIKGKFDQVPIRRADGSIIFAPRGGQQAGDYLEQKLMEWLFRGSAMPTAPTNVYVALYTAATDDTNAGGTEVTTSGTAYARQAVATAAGWAAPGSTGGSSNNVADIVYAIATANYGTVGWVSGQDAVTVGNRFFHGAVTASKTINSGDQAIITAATLVVTFS